MGSMRQFRAYAMREGEKKYSGTFTALSEEDAREKLKSQNYEIISLEEVHSHGVVTIIILLVVLVLICTLLILAAAAKKQENQSGMLTAFGMPTGHPKTPLDVLGKWVTLKSGKYLIAPNDEAYFRAIHYRDNKDTASLDKMVADLEIGRTETYGGGQKVRVGVWHDAEHVVEVRFKGGEANAWVEEEAVI